MREETDADLPFLTALYASTRADELAQVPDWDDTQRHAFLAQQFAAQRRHYRNHIPDCRFAVIERCGLPIGRLYLAEGVTQLNLVDIALVPAARGKGLGHAIMAALLAATDRAGKTVGLFVERENPAMRLYRRLGFVDCVEAGFYVEMERPARAPVPVS